MGLGSHWSHWGVMEMAVKAQLSTGRDPGVLTPPAGMVRRSPNPSCCAGPPPRPVPPIWALSAGLFSFPGELQLTQFRKYSLAGGGGCGEWGVQRSSPLLVSG